MKFSLPLQLITILCAVAVATGLTYWFKGSPQRYGQQLKAPYVEIPKEVIPAGYITVESIFEVYQEKVIWVDGRSRSDWKYDGVKKSLFISADPRENMDDLIADNMEALNSAENSNTPLVIYCASSGCSTSEMVKKGIQDAGFEMPIFLLHKGYSAIVSSPHKLTKNR